MPSISDHFVNVSSDLAYSCPDMSSHSLPSVKPEDLKEAIRQSKRDMLILDCRSSADYLAGHIRGAFNVALPTLILRRLDAGKLALPQALRHLVPDSADTVEALYTHAPIILYDYGAKDLSPSAMLMTALCRRLVQEGCRAHCLRGKSAYSLAHQGERIGERVVNILFMLSEND